MLVRCLYGSRAVETVRPATVNAIVEQSRRNNPPRGITGLLCCSGDIFVQVLEGGREPVNALLALLFRDERHRAVQILAFEEIAERRFGGWTMAQANIDKINPALLLKYYARAEMNPFDAPGAATMALFMELAASGTLINRPGC